jgi:hypothetical protein
MTYDNFYPEFENNYVLRNCAKIWFYDLPFICEEWRNNHVPFTKENYLEDKTKYLFFQWIDDQFECGNPSCKSDKISVIWYGYHPYGMGMDDSLAELYCPLCGKYTFIEYNRDSS